MNKTIRIAGASGYWGDSMMGTQQFLSDGNVDYIVFDFLAEITMSIMARARQAKPEMGYATDFISGVLKPHLKDIAAQNIKIISNAGCESNSLRASGTGVGKRAGRGCENRGGHR